MKEVWKDIVGFEGLFKISNTGLVLNCLTGEVRTGSKRPDGYWGIKLKKDGVDYNKYIHRLVAYHFTAFVPEKDVTYQINHKDENQSNNIITNLIFTDAKGNANYGTRIARIVETRRKKGSTGGKGKPVRCVETGIVYHSIMEAERQTDIKNTLISKCCKGYQNTAGGYHWEYV